MVSALGSTYPVGSIVDVDMAGGALADGTADLVEMTRAQIADPDVVAKAAGGVPEQIRPCVRCNQLCRVRDNRNPKALTASEAIDTTTMAPIVAAGFTDPPAGR